MNYMRCMHKRSKKRLVSVAYDVRGKHFQYFEMRKCCKTCGKQIEEKS